MYVCMYVCNGGWYLNMMAIAGLEDRMYVCIHAEHMCRHGKSGENDTHIIACTCWTYLHVHTYIHSYEHIYIHSYAHIYIHSYVHIYMHSYMGGIFCDEDIYTHTHSYVLVYMHSCLPRYGRHHS
jgi:hypothetical protein